MFIKATTPSLNEIWNSRQKYFNLASHLSPYDVLMVKTHSVAWVALLAPSNSSSKTAPKGAFWKWNEIVAFLNQQTFWRLSTGALSPGGILSWLQIEQNRNCSIFNHIIKSIDLNARNYKGLTALHLACRYDKTEIVKVMMWPLS